jgi:putative NADH-flavin reductase
MKITIFGATGGTGTQLVRQGLAEGHEVTAVVRDPSRLTAGDPRAEVLRADVMDPAAIEPAVAGRDAVVTAIGSRTVRAPTSVCADSVRSIIEAMEKAGVDRLVLVSAAGLEADAGDGPVTRHVLKPLLLQRILKHPFADMRRAEEEVRASGLRWTIVRPPRLTDRDRTGIYRTAEDLNIRGGRTISRADLADCVLRLVEDPGTTGHVISVAY